MSKRTTKKTGGERATTHGGRVGSKVLYVYCVGEEDALAPLFAGDLPAAIEDTAGLESIAGGGGLSAIVSAVSPDDYGEASLEARLADPTWTATRAMRHEGVVEFFAARASVVPLRFGTIYLRREGVEAMLKERHDELQSILARLSGREEWGVNVYCDRAKLKEKITSVSPRLREMAGQAAAAPPGQSYLLLKKVEAMRADETRDGMKRTATEIERALDAVSEGSARLRVLKGEATDHGETAAKFAFLVARQDFEKFRAEAERLADAHAALGFRLELTGPWPAYNFAAAAKE